MNQDNNADLAPIGLVAGGLLLVGLFSILTKAFTKYLVILGKFFDALSVSTNAFFTLCFAALKVVTIVAVAALVIGFVGYLVFRYAKLVREATKVREEILAYKNEMHAMVESTNQKVETFVNQRMREMTERLNEAIKPPEVAPPPKVEVAETSASTADNESTDVSTDEVGSDLEGASEDEDQGTEDHISNVTNPY